MSFIVVPSRSSKRLSPKLAPRTSSTIETDIGRLLENAAVPGDSRKSLNRVDITSYQSCLVVVPAACTASIVEIS
jgi:hypothetical protein